MRLLDKKNVASEAASQRKAQIDEGLRLAQKIDKLRSEKDSLEEQRNRFIAGAKEELAKQTLDLVNEIAVRKAQIVELEAQRKRLLEPLDNQRALLTQREAELNEEKDKIAKGLQVIQEKTARLDEIKKKEKESLQKIKIREHELERAYLKAENHSSETEKIHNDLIAQKDSWVSQKAQEEKEIKRLQGENEFNRQANENMKEILHRRELELNDREKMVNDRYQTLLRSEQRLNK